MNELLLDYTPLFADMKKLVTGFKKSTYPALFGEFTENNKDYFEELSLAISTQERQEFISRYAAGIVDYAQQMVNNAGSKIAKENFQLTMNMFMAVYFMPAVLKTQSEDEAASELTEAICTQWGQCFKASPIRSASFETIQAGFKSKLCYVTTAVCRSMNKPEDCYELNLLKNYRDRYLLSTKTGEELVHEYYNIAPTIVKRIDKSAKPEDKYRAIWENYLKPCISLIELGEDEACSGFYVRMVEELRDEYLITEGK